jgi:hypothetical protein
MRITSFMRPCAGEHRSLPLCRFFTLSMRLTLSEAPWVARVCTGAGMTQSPHTMTYSLIFLSKPFGFRLSASLRVLQTSKHPGVRNDRGSYEDPPVGQSTWGQICVRALCRTIVLLGKHNVVSNEVLRMKCFMGRETKRHRETGQ